MDVCMSEHVCACVYTVIPQIYLSAIVIELVEIANKSELSQSSFLSFSKVVNREKMLPSQSQKKVNGYFANWWLTENSPISSPRWNFRNTKQMQCP